MTEKLISKYRTPIMGFAALWIAVLHAQMWFRNPFLQSFKLTGQGGVDLFLFLSGFGLYYAYMKGERGWEFYKKRLLRIVPFYIPAVIARCYYYHYDLKWSLLFASTISFWTGFDRSYWYFAAILVLYAFAPLYLNFFTKGDPKKVTLVTFLGALAVSVIFWHTTQLIFFARVPIFVLGFYAGKRSYDNAPADPHIMWKALLGFVIGGAFLYAAHQLDHGTERVLYGYGMYWYPNLLLVPSLCLFLARIFSWLDQHKGKFVTRGFVEMGKASFAIYLLHDMCMRFFVPRIHIPAQLTYNGILLHSIIIVLTIVISVIYQYVISGIMKLFMKE